MAFLNKNLRDFWSVKSRNKVLYGGRASSKSHDACGRLIYLASKYKLKILCVRQFQNKIVDSVYTLLKDKIEAFNLRLAFDILNTSIKNRSTGSEFLFYGINRNIDEIKSTENVDILYIEEAHSLTENQWQILEPTIRKENSEIWIIFNPRYTTDFIYKRFIINTPPNTIKRHINYSENPFLSKTILDIIKAKEKEDREEYEHIYLGVPLSDDNNSFIKRSWIEAAIDSHKKLDLEIKGSYTIGFDIADDGDDKCATVSTYGILTTEIHEWLAKEDELNKSIELVYNLAQNHNSLVNYDSIGIGASVGSTINSINIKRKNNIKHNKYNAGSKTLKPDLYYDKISKIKNKDFFSNLKAQTWWKLSERFKITYNAIHKGYPFDEDQIISIDSNCSFLDQLKEELSTPKKDFDETGKVKVESKKDLKKRGIPSPNLADAFIMAYAYNTENTKKKDIEVKPIERISPLTF